MSRFQKVCLIEVQQEGQPTLTRLYEQNTLLLGRSTEVQIGISDPGVSRNHLEITRKNGKIWITDLGSANGTFVNGTQLTAHAKTVYNLGDPIQVGSQRIQISINIIEKAFDIKSVKDSTLDEDEKDSLIELVQAAHSEAQRISEMVKEQAEQAIRSTEQKASNKLSQANLQADEIISAAHTQANQITEDAKRKHAALVLQAETDAQQANQNVFRKAEQNLIDSEQKATEILREAEKQAQDLFAKKETEGRDLLQQARKEIQQLRLDWESEREKLRKESDEKIQQALEDSKTRAREIIASAEKQKLIILEDANKQFELAKNEAQEKSAQYYQQAETELKAAQKRSQEILIEFQQKGEALLEQKSREAEHAKKQEIEEARRQIELLQREANAKTQSTQQELEQLEQKVNELKEIQQNLELSIDDRKQELQQIHAQIETNQNSYQEFAANLDTIKQEYSSTEAQLQKTKDELHSAEEERKNTIISCDQIKQESIKLKEQADLDLRLQKEKAQQEIESYRTREQENIDKMKVAELEKLKEIRAEAQQDLNRHREVVTKELLRMTEEQVLSLVKPALDKNFDWSVVSKKLQTEVKSSLEEFIFNSSGGAEASEEVKIISTKASRWAGLIKQFSLAAAASILLLFLIPTTRELFLTYFQNHGIQQAAESFSKEMADERARRYNPEKTQEWKNNYTDAVLYTEGFLELKLSPEYQDQWIRDLHDFLYGELRIDEDSIVKIVSLEAALITRLKEKAELIHPDYVTEHTKKMRELENELLPQLTSIFNNEKKYKRFKEFSENYYYQKYLHRLPAQNRQ